ncbi:TPA: hypothetical protein HIF24_20095 [Escherichia coli]|nr:hypothetical protein [Escherichia coli]
MSVLINEKLHSRRLKWRWPLSRQVTLSIGTLAVLLTVWWTVAALLYTDIKVVSFNMKKTLKLSTSSDRPT